MSLRFALLASRKIIRIAGPEALGFLQSLISNDVEKVSPDRAIFAALLSAQGKLQFDFIVVSDGAGGYLLDVEGARADELTKKLKLYRLRAKAMIEPSSLAVVAVFGDRAGMAAPKIATTVLDPRHEQLGWRIYGDTATISAELAKAGVVEADEPGYAADRVALGVPEGAGELGVERLFLLEANAEELHGVDFKKGCYVGQELTARMKHKTELKKRLLPFHVSAPAAAEAALSANGRELGNVVGGGSGVAFALVRLDRLAEADAASLKIGDAPARLMRPTYLSAVL